MVFSLGGWCRPIQTGFLRSRPTQDPPTLPMLAGTGLSPSAAGLPRPFPFAWFRDVGVLQPRARLDAPGLGSFPFARRYLGNHCYFLFLRVLRCFSSPRSPLTLSDDRPSACRVVPFGNLRIKGHLHLHGAYRSLSRPSSPPRAKASAMCPYLISSSTPLNIQGEEYTFSCKSICIAAEDPLDLSFTFACYNMSNISSKHYACLLCGE